MLFIISRHNSQEPSLTLQNIDFGNKEHLALLTDMGISFQFQDGGRVMLVHHANKVSTLLVSQSECLLPVF